MKFRLMCEADPRAFHERNLVDEFGVESQFARELRIFFERGPVLFIAAVQTPMQEAGHPFKVRFVAGLFDYFVNLVNRRRASTPRKLSRRPYRIF